MGVYKCFDSTTHQPMGKRRVEKRKKQKRREEKTRKEKKREGLESWR
jgi:hypothetical protein